MVALIFRPNVLQKSTVHCSANVRHTADDHCAFGFAGGGAPVLADPFFFLVFFFGAAPAGAA